MGNHELNALAFHTPDPANPGEHLRLVATHNPEALQAAMLARS